MASRWSSDKPSLEPLVFRLLTHICVTRPQWVQMSWGVPFSKTYSPLFIFDRDFFSCIYRARKSPLFYCILRNNNFTLNIYDSMTHKKQRIVFPPCIVHSAIYSTLENRHLWLVPPFLNISVNCYFLIYAVTEYIASYWNNFIWLLRTSTLSIILKPLRVVPWLHPCVLLISTIQGQLCSIPLIT